MTIMQLSTDRM